jgi:hypothetical protein
MMDLPSFTELLSQQKPYMLLPLTHTQLAWIGLEGKVRHAWRSLVLNVDTARAICHAVTTASATYRMTTLARSQ